MSTLDTFDRVEPFACVIPAGTPSTAPVERATVFPPGFVQRVEVLVPPGHNGTTGFALAQAHNPVHPERAGAFIVASNETFRWPIVDDSGGGQWSLFGYNTDGRAHTFYVRFYVVELNRTRVDAVPLVTPFNL